MTILTIEEARLQSDFIDYGNGVYEYKVNAICHLIINGVDVLVGKNADSCCYHGNGVYKYRVNGEIIKDIFLKNNNKTEPSNDLQEKINKIELEISDLTKTMNTLKKAKEILNNKL